MDSNAMVIPRRELGRELVSLLEDAGIAIAAAAWIHEAESAGWRFALVTPAVDGLGRHRTYERIQSVLRESSFEDLRLSDVLLLSPREPDSEALVKLARSKSDSGDLIPIHGASLRGRAVDGGYVLRSRPLEYERALLRATKSIVDKLHLPVSVNGAGSASEDAGYDFRVDGARTLVIEAKWSSRPVGLAPIQRSMARLPGNWVALFVSSSGFSTAVRGLARQDPQLWILRWRGPVDDPELEETLRSALGYT